MDSSHRVPIVRINEIFPHPNADRLEIVKIGGYQCVVGKGQFKSGELAVYVQPDSIVPDRPEFSFVWAKDGGGQTRVITPEMEIPEKWRRITVRKLRKEWSEGLLMSIPDLGGSLHVFTNEDQNGSVRLADLKGKTVSEDQDVAEILGITHYNPPEPEEVAERGPSRKQSKVWPRSLKGWLYFLSYWLSFGLYNPWGELRGENEKAPSNTPPIYDVETLKNFPNAFQQGEPVIVTEKIHGSNFRALYQDNHFYVGSRRLWKKTKSNCIWRRATHQHPWIEQWCQANPGHTLYGEVVPTQAGFNYGTKPGEVKVFIFDVLGPDGNWLPHSVLEGVTAVPLLHSGPYDLDLVKNLAAGQSTLDSHIMEGVVIRSLSSQNEPVLGLGRKQLKIISNEYLEQEKE